MSNKFQYNSIGKTIDGTNYCAGMETFAQNLIEDNEQDATITYPSSDGWITARNDSFRITSDNAQIILPSDIYKKQAVEIKIERGLIYVDLSGYDLVDCVDDAGNHIQSVDIDYYVVDENLYQALPTLRMWSEAAQERHKRNTILYIKNILEISKRGDANEWLNEYDVFNAVITTLRFDDRYKNFYIYIEATGEKKYLKDLRPEFFGGITPKDLQFRISYIPISSDTKLRARKSAKTNVDYIQPINQRAEINSVSALGKFLHNTAQKTGTSQITLVRWYKHLADIPPVGAWVKHKGERYILTANSYEMTNCVQLKVTHTLSKNWSNKSQYVSVDQKYRNYNIPADMLWRNLYWEDFVEVTTDDIIENVQAGALDKHEIANIFKIDASEDKTVTSFFMYKTDPISLDGVTVPCSTLGTANSMVFAASMKDNRSAGLRINAENSQYCEEVFYCKNDGTLNAASIILSDGVKNFDSAKYPYSDQNINHTLVNTPDNRIFQQNFYIDKDPGEALKFTYQVHFLSDNPDVIIGSKLSENHPLVKKWTGNRKFKFWKLNKKLRPGNDKVSASDGAGYSISSENTRAQYWVLADSTLTGVQAFKLQLASRALLNISDKKAWAITDEDNNLYVGCNDVSKTTLYFSHIHKRK